ncbi:transcriptional regulator [Methanocaldococcus sp.]|uniref:transcriptional regulator n=1 Tax=Methanocaldococcus sp. TaxID=2152917 RepID=UPI002627D5ED|nr:transcriptional regulator [Methanocaldococcus sp.]MCQ6254646.1 transcriptional regulator [Methanocaldococcus sp.]
MIPLVPTSRTEIDKLEHVLILGTLFRPEILELIKDPVEKVTWVDSLAIAAGALAREKAGYTIREIADELGRTEQTIRKHLKGETKAGKLVRETYEMLKRGELNIEEVEKFLEAVVRKEDIEEKLANIKKLEEEIEKLKKENEELAKKLEKVKEILKEALKEFE